MGIPSSPRRSRSIGLFFALFTVLLPNIALAQRHSDGRGSQTVASRGIITAIDAATRTLTLAQFDTTRTTVRVDTAAVIMKGGQSAAFTALAVNDFVELLINRRTRLATRVEVNAAPTVIISGYITALDAAASTLQVTSTRGTSITLRTTANTRIRFQNRTTTLAGLAVGELVEARYALADKTASEVVATAPRTLIGTLVGVDQTARTLQYSTLGGVMNTVNLSPDTILRLNGRQVAPGLLTPGLDVSIAVNLANNSALDVAAFTPPLLELAGTVTSLDAAAGTVVIGNPFGTAITLRTTATTTITLNNVTAQLSGLAPADRVSISYQRALPTGVSTALRITATR
jgi:hypothetical protein